MSGDPLLDHLEKTFSDSYRKEIDQEENVWRSLPFFAATLALQLAGLAQVRDWLIGVTGPRVLVATVLLALAGVATLAAIVFLGLSVWPADFQYVAREPGFRDYAEKVRAQQGASTTEGTDQISSQAALRIVKAALAEQYATATDNNRIINQMRARWRTRAGLATLASVFSVLVLVALVVISNIHGYGSKADDAPVGGKSGEAEPGLPRPPDVERHPTAPDGSGAQGLVGRPNNGTPGGGVGGGRP